MKQSISRGAGIVGIAYIIWGFLTLFWNLLSDVSPLYILSQRILWSMVLMCLYITVLGKWDEIKAIFKDRKTLVICFISGTLVTINWGVYIMAVNTGHILDSCLGYFIEPIVVAAIGLLLFKEQMSKQERITFVFASVAMIYLLIANKAFPTIPLVIAFTFSAYGAVKKSISISSHASLFMETLFMTPFALALAIYMEWNGTGAIGTLQGAEFLLLPACGLVTSVPLLLFGIGVKQLPYYITGILMYVSPTISFILGLVYFHEALDAHRLIAFVLIWIGILFTIHEKITLIRKSQQNQSN